MTTEDQQVTVNVGEALIDLQNTMNEQNKIIHSLVEQVQKQQEFINTKLEDRDRKLMAAIRENQETKKLTCFALCIFLYIMFNLSLYGS